MSKARDDNPEITATETIIGTPAYMAPEQCRGLAVDARSDLYALGAVAYHMLAGQAPFRSDNALGYLLAHVQEVPAPLPASIPPGLGAWVLRLLAKAPADRFASAEEARVHLASALTGEATWQFTALGDQAPATLTHHAGAAASMTTRTTRKTWTAGGPKRWLWIAGSIGLTAAIVLLAVRPGGSTAQGAEGGVAPPSGPVANAVETLDELKSAKAMTARLGVQAVRDAALLFEATYYKAPESIHALVERGQLRQGARRDPWGREYRFETRAGKTRVCSLGRDGVPDTAGASGGDDICAE